MERKVVWINKEERNTTEDRRKGEVDSRQRLQSDQAIETKMSNDLHSEEENISDGYSNGKERYVREEIRNKDTTMAGFNGYDFNQLKRDYNRKGINKSKDSSITDIQSDHDDSRGADEFRMKREWHVKNKDSYASYKNVDLQIYNDMERKAENSNSIHADGLNIKDHSETGEGGPGNNYNDNMRTDEKWKHGGSSGTNIEYKMISSDGYHGSINVGGSEVKIIIISVVDEPTGEEVGESDCRTNNCSTKVFVKTDEIDYSSDDDEEGYVNTGDNSGDGPGEDVTEEIYQDEDISPSFGIMSIYCSSEIHYNMLPSCA